MKVDPSQVDQIMANLCINARDAIESAGKLTIETKNVFFDDSYCAVHTEYQRGHYVMLALSDDGRGISQEDLEHIFEPFFTTKEVGKGTGMGLATVYGIVKQNNGIVDVESEPGQGTTFRIYLPRFEGGRRIGRARRRSAAEGGAGGNRAGRGGRDQSSGNEPGDARAVGVLRTGRSRARRCH